MPATIKFIDHWDRVDVCLDIGGGRFSNVADYLGSIGVSYYNYDPYNQSYEQNLNAVEHCSNSRSDLVMINNVLNVIQDKQGRYKVLMQAHNACHAGTTVYTLIYEGDKTGVGKSTGSDKWQENARTATYMDMHSQFFGDVKK
ncbi:hypothetical protein I3271_03435 [Photobacterium leiognathi]|uniref:hypothetical protein n=1 Tax=Photobacterium leiognathi TaxID=553611 RepID=UPI001EDD1009|nr:hypothetical protein [Photobacterium leiognathi]MCG3883734.1 hypothetical protein [Photobacterium leiognathi]